MYGNDVRHKKRSRTLKREEKTFFDDIDKSIDIHIKYTFYWMQFANDFNMDMSLAETTQNWTKVAVNRYKAKISFYRFS